MILAAIWKFISGAFTSIIKFFAEHPMILVCIVVALIGLKYGYDWGSDAGDKKVKALTTEYAKQIKEKDEKIASVERDSTKAANEAKREIDAAKEKIASVSSGYEKRIQEMVKNPKIKVVVVPGAKETEKIFVNQQGEVSCRRFPDEFTQTINQMIDAANNSVITKEVKK